jgi:hypothetical protein
MPYLTLRKLYPDVDNKYGRLGLNPIEALRYE